MAHLLDLLTLLTTGQTTMNVLELVQAANRAGSIMTRAHSFLIYGPPKSGKTCLAATIAKLPDLDKIYWFDPDNGIEAVITMFNDGKLTAEQLAKIVYIKLPDTRETPTAIETLLKAIASKQAVKICEEHGRVGCRECAASSKPQLAFDYKSLTHRHAIVIDSLSQAGASALNAACLGKPSEFKPSFDEYGACGKWLGDLCTVLQATAYCHIFAITHVLGIQDSVDEKKEHLVPLCGTRAFSMNVAKYFGNVIYVEKRMKRHAASSSTLSNMTTHAGSRLGLKLEAMPNPDLSILLTDAGFFKGIPETVSKEEEEVAVQDAPVVAPPATAVKANPFAPKPKV